MTSTEIKHLIAEAFPLEPIPTESEILGESSYVDEEQLEIQAFFKNRRWDQVTVSDVFNFTRLSFLFGHSLGLFLRRLDVL